MGGEETGDDMFVFFGGEGAGGVAQPPAGADQFRGGGEDVGLAQRTSGDEFGGPIADGFGGFVKHAFAGAGGIYEDAVKKFGEGVGEAFGGFVGDDGVAHAPAFEVFGEVPHTLGVDFVGEQQALILHFGGHVGGFAAGGRGEVENALARLGIEDFGDGLCGGFLEVVQARGVVGVETGPVLSGVEGPVLSGVEGPGLTFEDAIPAGIPGNGFERERGEGLEFVRGNFEGVDA
jgi:hypothetical protein